MLGHRGELRSTPGTGTGAPPVSATTCMSSAALNKIERPVHTAPRAKGAAQIMLTGPPSAETRFNLPSAKNPMVFESGDQKGRLAPSVPSSDLGVTLPVDDTQSVAGRPAAAAANTIRRPSGAISIPWTAVSGGPAM